MIKYYRLKITKTIELIQFILGLIFIILNKIIKFSRKKPIISLLLIFGLWINSLPLPDEKIVTVRQDSQSQIKRTLTGQKALLISGGDGFTNPPPVTKNPGAEGASDFGPTRSENDDPSPRTPGGMEAVRGVRGAAVSVYQKLNSTTIRYQKRKIGILTSGWKKTATIATISQNLENQIHSQLR